MVHVACGRIDGYLENHLKLWDYAAGTLIVREAGGEVLDYGGRNLLMTLEGNVVVGNPYIEYSGWFYISCPVIWKSLFRSVFVHTES